MEGNAEPNLSSHLWGWGFSSRGGIFDPVWLPPTSTWREPRFEARSAARSARTGIVCDGRGIPAACRESCWQVRRAEDEAALCNLTQQSSKPRGSERGRPPSRLQWRRGRSQPGRGAAVVPRPRLRPTIKAAIFLSIRGLGRVGTQRHPARTGEKGRLLLQQSSLLVSGRVARLFWFCLPSQAGAASNSGRNCQRLGTRSYRRCH